MKGGEGKPRGNFLQNGVRGIWGLFPSPLRSPECKRLTMAVGGEEKLLKAILLTSTTHGSVGGVTDGTHKKRCLFIRLCSNKALLAWPEY
jgi:hypothetical protein